MQPVSSAGKHATGRWQARENMQPLRNQGKHDAETWENEPRISQGSRHSRATLTEKLSQDTLREKLVILLEAFIPTVYCVCASDKRY